MFVPIWIFFTALLVTGLEAQVSKNDKESNETESQDLKRSFGSFNDESVPQKQAYYIPFRPSYPILAQITPINENNEKISESFTGYIYPSAVSPLYYPYYSVLCRKSSDGGVSSVNEIEKLKEFHLNPLNEKMKEISAKIKTLSSFFEQNKTSSNNYKVNKISATEPEDDDDLKSDYVAEFSTGKEKETNKISTFNEQSKIFQCEGFTCPEQAESCKITDDALEPNYNEVVRTVLCLSKSQIVVSKSEKIMQNPKPGSSLHSSKTYSRDGGKEMMKNMQNTFDKAFAKFKPGVFKNFGTFQ